MLAIYSAPSALEFAFFIDTVQSSKEIWSNNSSAIRKLQSRESRLHIVVSNRWALHMH